MWRLFEVSHHQFGLGQGMLHGSKETDGSRKVSSLESPACTVSLYSGLVVFFYQACGRPLGSFCMSAPWVLESWHVGWTFHSRDWEGCLLGACLSSFSPSLPPWPFEVEVGSPPLSSQHPSQHGVGNVRRILLLQFHLICLRPAQIGALFSYFPQCCCAPKNRIGGSGPIASMRGHHSDTSFTCSLSGFDSSVEASFSFRDVSLSETISSLAPKSRIGGSGTTARSSDFHLCHLLFIAGQVLVPFYTGLLCISGLAVLRLWLRCIPGRASPLGRCPQLILGAVPFHVALCWNFGSLRFGAPATLSWRGPPLSKRPRPAASARLSSWGARLLIGLIGFAHMPFCAWAAPTGLAGALNVVDVLLKNAPDAMPPSCPSFNTSVSIATAACEPVYQADSLHEAPARQLPKHCAIMKAGFPVQHVLVYAHLPCSEAVFCQHARDLFEDPDGLYDLHPTVPQIAPGISTLVAAPAWMNGSGKTIYILDFSFWGGPVYAVADWDYVSRSSLAPAARRYAPEPWQVFSGSSCAPLPADGAVTAVPGQVFLFLPSDCPGLPRPLLKDMLLDVDCWDDNPQYIPREVGKHTWFAMRSHVNRLPAYDGPSFEELCEIAAAAFDNTVQELVFAVPEHDSPLRHFVYQGELMRGVLAAEPCTPSGSRPGALVFFDPRALGLSPFFRVCMPGWLAVPPLAAFLGFKVPTGFSLTAKGVPCREGEVQVYDGCTVSLFLDCGDITFSAPPPGSRTSLSTFGNDEPGGRDNFHADPGRPQRFDREGVPAHDPEHLLGAGPRDEEAEEPAERTPVTATFLVLAPRFQCEAIQLSLRFPTTVEQVLDELADANGADFSLFFDRLQPALPQPDTSFGVVLALPPWSHGRVCVLVDARQLDNRLFAHDLSSPVNKESILMQLHVSGRLGARLFCHHNQELVDDQWYHFNQGDTLFVLPTDVRPGPAVLLADMLQGPYDWVAPCPTYGGPHFPAFCVLSDGAQHVILVDVDSVRSFSDFRRLAATELRYTSDRVLVSSSLPRVTDLDVLGQHCKAILVATEYVVRVQIPPGRLSMLRTIAFVDRRCLLQDFIWVVAERGLLDPDLFLEPYQAEAPEGFSVNLKGAATELRGGRSYLRIPNGTLLTLTYVANEASSSDLSGFSSDDNDPSGSSGDSTDDTRDRVSEHSPTTVDVPGREGLHLARSRSPRPRRPAASQVVKAVFHGLPFERLWFSAFSLPHGQRAALSRDQGHVLLSAAELTQVASDSFGFREQKLLCEPPSSSGALSASLAFLRHDAPRLGAPWRYLPDRDAPFHIADSDAESSAADSSDEPTTLHFTLLTPGFIADRLALRLQLPSTWSEVMDQIQAIREPTAARDFPCLAPAVPQPCPGSGVVLALPAWHDATNRDRPYVCLDVSAIDGRLYTAACPAYVSCRHLLRLADLSGILDVCVHVGGDPTPLLADAFCHVATGDTFVFVPARAVVPTLLTLHQCLSSSREWSPVNTVPPPETDGHYCLVHEAETILFATRFEVPMQYRSQIAACVGLPQRSMRLTPAAPRVCNASLDGYCCRAVIAVDDMSALSAIPVNCILLDARALLLGWRTFSTVAGRISCNTVRVQLQADFDPNMRVSIREVPDEVDFLEVQPGQVLVVIANLREAANLPPVHAAGAQPDSGAPDSSGASGPDTSVHGATATAASPAPGLPHSADGDTAPHDRQSHDPRNLPADEVLYISCSFLVLGQNYLPEHVEVRLPAGIDVEGALRFVAAARAPNTVNLLPCLYSVHPQPKGTHALALACPAWPINCPVVAFDCRAVNGALFALQLTSGVTREGLLRAAQIDLELPVDVYVGSQPWPVPADASLRLFHGDLILIAPARAPAHVVSDLSDMLQTAAGWDPAYDPASDVPGGFPHFSWIISWDSSFLFCIQPDRSRQIRQDLAQRLNVLPRDFELRPAHLELSDFAHRGLPARTVLAACRQSELLPSAGIRSVVCFIDARPLLLYITYHLCPAGLFDTGPLLQWFAARCPIGWQLCLIRSGVEFFRLLDRLFLLRKGTF